MTGQYPKRRESDTQARHRNEQAEEKRREHLAGAFRVPFAVWKSRMPYITASGRLVRP